MPFSEALAARIREIFAGERDIAEKKMFGGIAFLIRGHMCAGIMGDDLMLRIGEDLHGDALKCAHVRPMDFTGRPLRGFIYVDAAGIKTKAALKSWLDKGAAFARSLPPKKVKKKPAVHPKTPRTRATR